MNDFEKEIFNEFLIQAFGDFMAELKNKPITEAKLFYQLNPDEVSYAVYNDLWQHILYELSLKLDDRIDCIKTILRNAYLYTHYEVTPQNEALKTLLEETNLDGLINVYMSDILIGTALTSINIKYLLLINEDLAFKELLEEDLTKKQQTSTIKKLTPAEVKIISRNNLYRRILFDYYVLMIKDNYDDDEIYHALDAYFHELIIRDEIKNRYQILDKPKTFEHIVDEQIKMIFQTVYLSLRDEPLLPPACKMISHINDTINQKDCTLPQNKNMRWQFYQLFLNYYYECDLETDLINLSAHDRKILKQISPYFFLDFPADELSSF